MSEQFTADAKLHAVAFTTGPARPAKAGRMTKVEIAERDRLVCEAHASGAHHDDISLDFGISASRVSQIICSQKAYDVVKGKP